MTAHKCTECGQDVHELEIFPKGKCLACHARNFDENEAGKTAAQKARELRRAFRPFSR